jgi:hypothetical protein
MECVPLPYVLEGVRVAEEQEEKEKENEEEEDETPKTRSAKEGGRVKRTCCVSWGGVWRQRVWSRLCFGVCLVCLTRCVRSCIHACVRATCAGAGELSSGAIVGIVLGSFFGVFILLVFGLRRCTDDSDQLDNTNAAEQSNPPVAVDDGVVPTKTVMLPSPSAPHVPIHVRKQSHMPIHRET